jgi:hypothetical protein
MSDSQHTISEEIWKPVPDYPGYEISSLGRLRSYWKIGQKENTLSIEPQRIINQTIAPSGYFVANLAKNKRYKTYQIHRVVLLAFVGPCPPKFVCCHKDGNRLNNILSNLRWDSYKGNEADKKPLGIDNAGERHGSAKLTADTVIAIRRLCKNYHRGLFAKVGRLFNIDPRYIASIHHRQRWKHLP